MGELHDDTVSDEIGDEPDEVAALALAGDAAPAAPEPVRVVAPSRAQYRALADQLMLDEHAWNQFFNRCKCFAAAGMYGHKTPETVAAAGLKGMSLGMSFMEALDRIKVIKGTPVIRGSAAINHIHERCAGAKCRCISSTDTEAVWRMERPGWETREFRYTWEQAVNSGIVKRNDVYKAYPARCLKWQAASEGAQEMFGDVLGGLYFQEEIEGAHGVAATPRRVVQMSPDARPAADRDPLMTGRLASKAARAMARCAQVAAAKSTAEKTITPREVWEAACAKFKLPAMPDGSIPKIENLRLSVAGPICELIQKWAAMLDVTGQAQREPGDDGDEDEPIEAEYIDRGPP